MHAFKRLEHPICHSKHAKTVFQKYKELDGLLTKFEEGVFSTWVNGAEEKSLEGLNRPLLVRDKKTRILKVNFGREALECLQEAKYLQKDFPERKIPETVRQLFARFKDFKAYNNGLDRIVDLYNYLKTGTIEKEYRLFENEVAVIDKNLEPALTSLTWNSEDLQGYIERIFERVKDLNERVRDSQDNIIKIHDEVSFNIVTTTTTYSVSYPCQVSRWEDAPLFMRAEDGDRLLNQRDRAEKRNARYAEVKRAGIRILTLINENRILFDTDLDDEREKRTWSTYLRYIDGIITDSLLQAVATSLGYLLDETDVEKQPKPLFATRLELSQPDLVFQPSLEKDIVNNFYDTALSLVDDIMGMAGLIPRIATSKAGANYIETIRNHTELKRLKDIYISRLEAVIAEAKEEADKYLDYSHLWTESRKEHLQCFLEFSRQVREGSKNVNVVFFFLYFAEQTG